MNDPIDLLQIRIEKAKRELPAETLSAIAAVDWRAAIFDLRKKYGYTFEQLGDLELQTELLLCGLVQPENYPKELQSQMGISKMAANELANTMNDLVFRKIREELVKNTERKKYLPHEKKENVKEAEEEKESAVLNSAGIEIIKEKSEEKIENEPISYGDLSRKEPTAEKRGELLEKIENPESANNSSGRTNQSHPILAQKLTSHVTNKVVKTEHSLDNISRKESTSPAIPDEHPRSAYDDPYRVKPE